MMGALDFINGKSKAKKEKALEAARLLVASANQRRSIIETLTREQMELAKADIEEWMQAREAWDDIHYPDRTELYNLYKEVEIDDAVVTHSEKIKLAIKATEFEVTGEDGETDEKAHKLFDQSWFDKFLDILFDAEMQGYTLVEFPEPELGKFNNKKIKVVPREHVWPEKQLLMKRPADRDNVMPYKKKLGKSLLEIGGENDKGRYNVLAPLFVYKTNSVEFWSAFQGKFGVPPVIAKTDLDNDDMVKTLKSFLEEMQSNSFGLADRRDEIEALHMANVDAYKTFDELRKAMEMAIGKVLEGQTMTTNDGSSLAQAEVHKETAELFHLGRLISRKRAINDYLIPFMIQKGFPLEGKSFRWKESKDLDAIIDRILKLYQAGLKVDAKWVEETTGMPVEEVLSQPKKEEPVNTLKEIQAFYGVPD